MTPLYAGIGGVVRELTEMHTGIGGAVRELTEMWARVDGVNRQIFSAVKYSVVIAIFNYANYPDSDQAYILIDGKTYSVYDRAEVSPGTNIRIMFYPWYTQRSVSVVENSQTTSLEIQTDSVTGWYYSDYAMPDHDVCIQMYDASFPGGSAFDAQISKPIEFTVEGKTYQAPAELAWQFFVKTPYNVDGFVVNTRYVLNSEGTMGLYYGGNYVQSIQEVVENGAYTWGPAPS